MILLLGVALWFIALLVVWLTPRLTFEARRSVLYDLIALGGLGATTGGFFWRLLFTPDVWMPAGGGDLASFIYPTYRFAQEWITRGVIPLWNPYIFCGTSFIGDIQTALFYPLNLLTDFISNPLTFRDLEYLSVLHFFIAGAGMYALLRWFPFAATGSLARAACLAGAVAFEFSDLFITHFGNLNLIATTAWLPLIFLFFARALEKPGFSNALIAGLLLAIAFFAGHIQPFLFILLTLAVYAAYTAITKRRAAKRIAALLFLTILVGVGISAIVLLPGLEMSRLSVRTGFTYEQAAQFSLPPVELVGLVVPGFFGRGPENAWGPWQRVEVGYIGVLPLILAMLALVLRRNKHTLYFVLLALLGLAFAMGGYAILHGWLFQFVPGFGQIRAPARSILLLDFGLAALAAIGFDALVTPVTEGARRLLRIIVKYGMWIALVVSVGAGALALAILILGQGQDPVLYDRIARASNALAFFIILLLGSVALLFARLRDWLKPAWWAAAALGFIFFDLLSLGAYVDIGTSDPTLSYQRQDIVDFLRANTGLARIDSRTDVEGLWRPDTGLLYGLQDVYGDNPLVLSDFNSYWESLGGRDTDGYALLNVKYVLTRRGTPMPENFDQVLDGGGGITVYENKCELPRAWVIHNAKVAEDWARAEQLLKKNCFNRTPSLQGELIYVMGDEAREVRSNLGGRRPAEITGYGPNEIRVSVNAADEGYLVLSEVFAPGWRTWVDGNETPIVRADILFRAVFITAGEHTVRLAYDPLSYRIGALVSGATILVVVASLILTRKKIKD